MSRNLAVFALCVPAALAQSAMNAPRAGCMLDAGGGLRPVYGITGALLAGPPAASDVISAACSDSLALVKTTGALELRDPALTLLARWEAPPGPALFALPPAGQTAFAYFPATGLLVQVDAQSPPRAVLDSQSLGGTLLAIASPDPSHLLAVVGGAHVPRLVRVSVADGGIESQTALEDVAAPLALLDDDTLVFGQGASLIIRPPDARVQRMSSQSIRRSPGLERGVMPPSARPLVTERRLPLSGHVLSIDRMGGSWLAVRLSEGAPLALNLEGNRDRICRIAAATEAAE